MKLRWKWLLFAVAQIALFGWLVVYLSSIPLVPMIFLPKETHNVVGDTPIAEEFDDGRRNWGSVQTYNGGMISCDISAIGPKMTKVYVYSDN